MRQSERNQALLRDTGLTQYTQRLTFACHVMRVFFVAFGFISITGCSGFTRSEQEKLRRQNCSGETIYRTQNDVFCPIQTPEKVSRDLYPWEHEAHLPRITKEFFRCRGSSLNPPILGETGAEPITDCAGSSRHGLPVFGMKEGVYPVLIDLLNYLQKKTAKRAIITCGHRCPIHNAYAEPGKEALTSRHQIGAEVDFYMQGMEDQPLEVVQLILHYYQENHNLPKTKEWTEFTKQESKYSIQPWFNKEIFITLYQKEEGRDRDNRHPYPYLSLQVRYDREEQKPVVFNWAKAHMGYPRR